MLADGRGGLDSSAYADDGPFARSGAAGPRRGHLGVEDHDATASEGRMSKRSAKMSAAARSHSSAPDVVRAADVRVSDEVATTIVSGQARSSYMGASLSRTQQAALQLEDQLLGTASLFQASTHVGKHFVRRVDADGAVTLVHVDEATCAERVRWWCEHARVSLPFRLLPVALVLFACVYAQLTFTAYTSLESVVAGNAEHIADQQAAALRRCAYAAIRQASTVAASRAVGVLDRAVADTAAADAHCDPRDGGALAAASRALTTEPLALASFYGYDESTGARLAVDQALGDVNASFTAVRATIDATVRAAAAGVAASEAEAHALAEANAALMRSLQLVAAARSRDPFARFKPENLVRVTGELALSASISGAVVYGAFAGIAAANMSAGDPGFAEAGAASLAGVPVRTAYVESVRRVRDAPLSFANGLGSHVLLRSADVRTVPGAVAELNGLGDVIGDAARTALFSSAALLASSTTAWGRTTQATGWAAQVLEPALGEAAPVKPTMVYVAVGIGIVVSVAILAGILFHARRTQRHVRRALERQLEQRAVLQQAVAAFVPRHFLGLMGYETITAIRAGDHRLVTLSMAFFSVHNYAALGAGNRSERMFLFQQNLMVTCVNVTRRNDGFVDKFLGDGAFLLFTSGLDAVIASAELYQESQDLAVRRRVQRTASAYSETRSRSTRVTAQSRQSSLVRRNSATTARSAVSRRSKRGKREYDVPEVQSDSEGSLESADGDDDEAAATAAADNVVFQRRAGRSVRGGASRPPGSRAVAAGDAASETTSDRMSASQRTRGSSHNRAQHHHAVRREDIAAEDRVLMGIGVHTGEVCVGILGDAQRHSCTLISSKVNLASRLCKLTQKLKVGVLVSQETYESCGQEIEEEVGHYLRRFGSTKVYGQKNPTEVLELFACDDPAVRDYKLSTAGLWREALELQMYMRWDDAADVFKRIEAEGRVLLGEGTLGVDNRKFVDVPLELNKRLRARHHVFLEK